MKQGSKTADRPSSQKSHVSKYSAVPFSREIDFQVQKKDQVITPSDDDYSEDDFEDDYFETSHEGAEEENTEKGKTDNTAQ